MCLDGLRYSKNKGIARRLLGIVTRILKEKKLRGRVCRERGSTCVCVCIYIYI